MQCNLNTLPLSHRGNRPGGHFCSFNLHGKGKNARKIKLSLTLLLTLTLNTQSITQQSERNWISYEVTAFQRPNIPCRSRLCRHFVSLFSVKFSKKCRLKSDSNPNRKTSPNPKTNSYPKTNPKNNSNCHPKPACTTLLLPWIVQLQKCEDDYTSVCILYFCMWRWGLMPNQN